MTGRNTFLTDTAEYLHKRFNPRSDQIPPIRVKGFKRGSLARLFNELGFKVGAEIGVAQGYYSREICKANPGVKLYCVDLWDTYFRGTAKLKNRKMQDEAYNEAVKNLAPFDTELIRKPSDVAHLEFDDNSLDFVYIDGDHSFDYVMLDLIYWSRKVRKGGIVSGHDAYRFRGAGVVDAVSAYTHCHGITEYFLCDEREISFFWAKP